MVGLGDANDRNAAIAVVDFDLLANRSRLETSPLLASSNFPESGHLKHEIRWSKRLEQFVDMGEKTFRIAELVSQTGDASKLLVELTQRAHGLEVELSVARARNESKQTALTDLRAYRERREKLDEQGAVRPTE